MRAFSLARRLLHKVAGTLLTNFIPATPIDAFVGEVMAPTLADAKKPGRSTTDNRGLARSVPAWILGRACRWRVRGTGRFCQPLKVSTV
jgi:hypothetical protein